MTCSLAFCYSTRSTELVAGSDVDWLIVKLEKDGHNIMQVTHVKLGKKNCQDSMVEESTSNEEENDLRSLQRRNIKHFTPTSSKKIMSETQARITRTEINIQHDH
ncbi:unnamed protein product [Colias eurytheme]|nr:unnamed protein product [Colias eurytheme]